MKKGLPLVSVCMPAYNAERYVAEAIESILNQTYPNIELIVVNDGSTDGTSKILEVYDQKRVKIIYQENKGQCAAANVAFKESKGKLIKFFDADDILSPQFIELQVARLNGNVDCIASGEWARFYKDDLSTARFKPEAVWQDMNPIDWLVLSMQHGGNMMQCALWLIPRHILVRSGLWDERLSLINDFDFFIRVILSSAKILFANGAKLYYRSGLGNTLSAQNSRKAMESALLSTQLGTSHILAVEDSPRTRRICADAFQLWAYNFYPDFPDLVKNAEKYVAELGGSQLSIPGGRVLQSLSKITGWKMAKAIQLLAYHSGYLRYLNATR